MSYPAQKLRPSARSSTTLVAGIGIGALKGLGQRLLQLVTDRVELVRPIKGNDTDFVVSVVKD